MNTEAPDRPDAIPAEQAPRIPPVASTRRSLLQAVTVGAATVAVAGLLLVVLVGIPVVLRGSPGRGPAGRQRPA